MGAAEYEFGKFNDALGNLYNNDLDIVNVKLPDMNMKGRIYIVYKEEDNLQTIFDSISLIFYKAVEMLNERDWIGEVCKADHGSFLKSLYTNNLLLPHFDESECLKTSKDDDHNKSVIGWLNIEAHYAWFIDEKVAQEFRELLSINQEEILKIKEIL